MANFADQVFGELFVAIFGHALIGNGRVVRGVEWHQGRWDVDFVRIDQRHVAFFSGECGMYQARGEIEPEGAISRGVAMKLIQGLIRAVPIAGIGIIDDLRQGRARNGAQDVCRARPRADAVADGVFAISVVNRPDGSCLIPRAFQGVSPGGHLAAQPFVIVPAVVIMGVFAAPHARARRVAHRAVGVRVGEQDAFAGEAIQVRRGTLHGRMAHATHFAPVHALGVDKDDVWWHFCSST